jgi:tRNA(Met) cytidine acetyltransferase
LNKFPQCIFSTTVHGYEGTGRGFSVRFNKILNQQKPGWKKIQMKTPIRWAENDPLEQWMFNLLCLDADLVDKKEIGVVDNANLDIVVVQREDLANDDVLLHEIFSLLVLAHYRTQPSDLQRLLDDEELSIFIVKHNKHVVAIALVSHEGGFAKTLSTEVYRGERRPAGHLLAQTLTYHCGIEHAATLKYSRIMRIAVHPEFQEQGIGSKLLAFIIEHEKKKGVDAIGSSFGLNLKLLKFWQAAKLNIVRIGFTREQTSGEHAAIMLRPLSDKGDIIYQQAYSRFLEQIPYWLDDILIDLPDDIKKTFQTHSVERNTELSEFDNKDLYSFINYSRNYELCIAAINKLIVLEQKKVNSDFPEIWKQILNEKINNRKSWKQISIELLLGGKSAARQLFKTAIFQLMNKN